MNGLSVTLGIVVQFLRIAICVMLACWAGNEAISGQASSKWPSAQGTVISSTIKQSHSKNGTKDDAAIEYKYTVNGKSFTSDRVMFGTLAFRNAAEVVKQYPQNTKVDVHYNPADPGQATIETGFNQLMIWLSAAGCVLMLFLGFKDMQKMAEEKVSSRPTRNEPSPSSGRQRITLFLMIACGILIISAIDHIHIPGVPTNVVAAIVLIGGGLALVMFVSLIPVVIAHLARQKHLKLAETIANFNAALYTTAFPHSCEAAQALGLQAEVAREMLQLPKARQLGERSLNTAIAWHHLASEPMPQSKGRDLSDKMMLASLESQKKAYGDIVSLCHENLGGILFDMGHYDEAFTHAEKAVLISQEIIKNAGSLSHARSASSTLALASALTLKGRIENVQESPESLDDARRDLEQAVSLRKQLTKQFSESYAITLAYLATTYSLQGENEKAEKTINEGLSMIDGATGPQFDLARATLLQHQGECLKRAGKLKAARTSLDNCLQLREKLLTQGHPEIAAAKTAISGLAG